MKCRLYKDGFRSAEHFTALYAYVKVCFIAALPELVLSSRIRVHVENVGRRFRSGWTERQQQAGFGFDWVCFFESGGGEEE